MLIRPSFVILAGALATTSLALVGGKSTTNDLASRITADAREALKAAGTPQVTADFGLRTGSSPSRHAVLSGAETLSEEQRAKAAHAVAAVPGVGGVYWIDGTIKAERSETVFAPTHCQGDVEALLRARTIRFEESSSAIDNASVGLLDEVAAALRPCLGSIIAITGHTDSSGPEPGNLSLSLDRARSVRKALMRRGIPRDGLRARGVGSSNPVDGLDPADPANRRIEFAVISTVPVTPTPVDTPGAR